MASLFKPIPAQPPSKYDRRQGQLILTVNVWSLFSILILTDLLMPSPVSILFFYSPFSHSPLCRNLQRFYRVHWLFISTSCLNVYIRSWDSKNLHLQAIIFPHHRWANGTDYVTNSSRYGPADKGQLKLDDSSVPASINVHRLTVLKTRFTKDHLHIHTCDPNKV